MVRKKDLATLFERKTITKASSIFAVVGPHVNLTPSLVLKIIKREVATWMNPINAPSFDIMY